MAIIRKQALFRVAFTLGLSGVLASSVVQAQSSAQGVISFPDDIQIFENLNPNVRKATAVVNGDVITGTDVEQRLALILAANEGELTDEELKNLRLQVLRNLIDESLQIQEAKASDIEIERLEIEQSYSRV
ncbi:MAG: SurA N-terminal domain-containing protein, partial [Novosphingobium sp.]|nr:SurA N-terminal domain-containing protein [Novosphingobium sp.]